MLAEVAEPRLELTGLSKSYASPVLRGVRFSIDCGEIMGLVGENGAGKSTMANVIAGLVQMDAGQMRVDGKEVRISSVQDALQRGVSFAAQELSVISNLSVAENVGLRNLPKRLGRIDYECLYELVERLLDEVGFRKSIALNTRVGDLPLGERQLVEIAKAMYTKSRLLILDEPTAALNSSQAERLHLALLDRVKSGLSVLYISHRLNDVIGVCDRVTVLRDGMVELVARTDEPSIDVDRLLYAMSGSSGSRREIVVNRSTAGDVRLSAEAVTTKALPNEMSIDFRAGEICGIAGLAGSGRSELLQALFGLDQLESGRVRFRASTGHETEIHSAWQSVTLGIGYLPEDRKLQGIFPHQSIRSNVSIPHLNRMSSRIGVIDRDFEDEIANEVILLMNVEHQSSAQRIDQLSGGNQQKVLLGRWMKFGTTVFLLDEPTRGVDIRTKRTIYNVLNQLREQGATIVVVCSELEELLENSDRIAVMSNRKLVDIQMQAMWNVNTLLDAAFSGYQSRNYEVN